MYRLIRFLAVIALALSPVWGVQTVGAVNHAAYPVWPSFLSTGCNGIQGPGGSTTIACGQGAFLLSQVNSGYACTTVFISVTQYQSGPFTVVGTANSGSQTNTVSIDSPGDYYMQFPGYLTNNLIAVQISAPGSGAMTIGTIGTGPCPVPPSDTPVPATNTPNPSDTSTSVPDTATPGPSQTPTTIATFTPLPSGHSTFSPTPTATTIGTSTPVPSVGFNCGDANFPMLNCNLASSAATGSLQSFGSNIASSWYVGKTTSGVVGTYWATQCVPGIACGSWGSSHPHDAYVSGGYAGGSPEPAAVYQTVQSYATGTLHLTGMDNTQNAGGPNPSTGQICITAPSTSTLPSGATCSATGNDATFNISLTTVTASTGYEVWYVAGASGATIDVESAFITTGGGTVLPTQPPLPTVTPGPGMPTSTLIPIPGEQSTPIATSTDCPGGCAVAALTAIPGLSTRVLVDTSPFSELTHLSLARNSCKAFGYVQIPEPVIHGTPALGSTTPLSITWTLPVTHDWDNTNPYSNTAIQPCAMNEIPTFVWDLTYWFSVFAIFTVWIMWLLGFVGRFSGDENING